MRRQYGTSQVSLGHVGGWPPDISTEVSELLRILCYVRGQTGCRETAVSSSSLGHDSEVSVLGLQPCWPGFPCSVIKDDPCLEKK